MTQAWEHDEIGYLNGDGYYEEPVVYVDDDGVKRTKLRCSVGSSSEDLFSMDLGYSDIEKARELVLTFSPISDEDKALVLILAQRLSLYDCRFLSHHIGSDGGEFLLDFLRGESRENIERIPKEWLTSMVKNQIEREA